jgi:hypothetical protein
MYKFVYSVNMNVIQPQHGNDRLNPLWDSDPEDEEAYIENVKRFLGTR